MEELKLRTPYITLGQLLKAMGYVEDGVEAKLVINQGLVKINNETDLRRGRKCYPGDVVEYGGKAVKVVS